MAGLQMSMLAEQVRMQRFTQMESLDSLDALGVCTPKSDADRGSVGSDSAASQARPAPQRLSSPLS